MHDVQKTRPPDLSALSVELLRWFVLAAEAGSLSRAARQSHVAQSTVSRAVGRLESLLGVALFTRSGRAFHPTDTGAALLPHAREVLGELDAFSRAAVQARGGLRGLVRLSLCSSLGHHVLLPKLVPWRAARPGVHLDVRLEETDLDPRTAGLDVVVRAGRPKDSEAHRTPLGDYGHVVVAAPSYLRTHRRPSSPSELTTAETVAVRLERPWTTWPLHRGQAVERVVVTPAITVTEADALCTLACAGAGVTVLPDYLAAPHLAAGDLVELLSEWALPRIPVFAFHLPKKRLPRIVVEVLGALQEATVARATSAREPRRRVS